MSLASLQHSMLQWRETATFSSMLQWLQHSLLCCSDCNIIFDVAVTAIFLQYSLLCCSDCNIFFYVAVTATFYSMLQWLQHSLLCCSDCNILFYVAVTATFSSILQWLRCVFICLHICWGTKGNARLKSILQVGASVPSLISLPQALMHSYNRWSRIHLRYIYICICIYIYMWASEENCFSTSWPAGLTMIHAHDSCFYFLQTCFFSFMSIMYPTCQSCISSTWVMTLSTWVMSPPDSSF